MSQAVASFLVSVLIILSTILSLIILLNIGHIHSHIENLPFEFGEETLNSGEKNALLNFIGNVSHNPTKLTWNKSKLACSNWKGVICDPDNTTVLYIRLPGISLVGKIPEKSLGQLHRLRVLSLRYNALSGDLPSDFGNLVTLTHLYLQNNHFSGQIPYIDVKNLVKLDMSFNEFNSSIPYPFSNFPLRYFTNNLYFCGPPTNNTCNSSYIPSPFFIKPIKSDTVRLIIWISVVSGLVLLVLLLSVRKLTYSQRKRRHPSVEFNKHLVFLRDGTFGFKLDDLLNASAEVLGDGTSYKQTVEENKRMVVVKRLKDVKAKEHEFRQTMEVLRKVKDVRNVVPLIAFYYSEDEKWLVYDYMPGGSLFARLHGSIDSRRTPLSWDQRMRIAISAAKGLAYLHEAKVVHGNIKSSNILLQQETNEASMSDYGLNTLFGKPDSSNHHVTGYWAPEIFKTKEFTFESDVYSFGVLLFELLTGQTVKQASLGEEGVHFSHLVESDMDHNFEMLRLLQIAKDCVFSSYPLELGRDHNFEMLRLLLQIAKDCVSIVHGKRPTMHDVVRMMDNMWLRPSSDDHSRGYDETPSTDTRDTPSTSIFTP